MEPLDTCREEVLSVHTERMKKKKDSVDDERENNVFKRYLYFKHEIYSSPPYVLDLVTVHMYN